MTEVVASPHDQAEYTFIAETRLHHYKMMKEAISKGATNKALEHRAELAKAIDALAQLEAKYETSPDDRRMARCLFPDPFSGTFDLRKHHKDID